MTPSTAAPAPAPPVPARPPAGREVAPWLALRVLARSLALLGRNVPALVGVAVAASLPPVALVLAFALGETTLGLAGVNEVGAPVALGLWVLLTVVQAGAVTSGALGALRGRDFGVRRSVAAGLRRGPAALGVTVIGGAAVFAGTVVLIVPGVAALGSLALALPVAVDERAGPFRAIGRSLDLTRGHRPAVFAVVFALAAVGYGVFGASAVVLDSLSDVLGLALLPCLGFFWTLPAIGCAVAYSELRDAKDGPPASELGAVFE